METEYEGNDTLVHRLRSASNAEWTPMFDEAADEILRLNAELRYEQSMTERIGTHGPGCHLWGPAHYECLMREHEQITADISRLREGDTCARECEGTAYRIEARNLKSENEFLSNELKNRDKCSYIGPMRDCPTHGESNELRNLKAQLSGSLARNLELDGDIATLDQENKQLRARNERLEMELSRAIT